MDGNSALIQTFGIVVDLSYLVARVPTPGEEAKVVGSTMTMGGGYSAMFMARQLGMPVTYAGYLGNGPFSDLAIDALRHDGITCLNQSSVRPDKDLGVCVVLVEPNSERTFIKHDGIEQCGFRSLAEIASCVTSKKDWVHACGYTFMMDGDHEASLKTWFELGRRANVIFDPTPVHDRFPNSVLTKILGSSHWISMSESEALAISGKPTAKEACITLSRLGSNVVVRAAYRGAHVSLSNASGYELIPTVKVAAVDSNAAGETHIGAMAFALSRGVDPYQAAYFANVCAGLSTTRLGSCCAPSKLEIKSNLIHFPDLNILVP